MTEPLDRRRFVLRSLHASLALPGLHSLLPGMVWANGAVAATKGAGTGARRFVAVGNLLGFQQKAFLPRDERKGL